MPKIFRMTKGGKLIEGIFRGETINTPSMLCVADYLDALDWVRSMGGLPAAVAKSEANLDVIKGFVESRPWAHFLAQDPDQISNTSVCLTLDLEADQVKKIVKVLDEEAVAFDIGAYRDAPAGLRIWCGATVEASRARVCRTSIAKLHFNGKLCVVRKQLNSSRCSSLCKLAVRPPQNHTTTTHLIPTPHVLLIVLMRDCPLLAAKDLSSD